VASEQDAARDRVLAAREAFDREYQGLTASTREAIDIPARIRRNPAKVAAVAGGAAFLLMRGPQRVVRGTRRMLLGAPAPLPEAMLPDEIEKTLKSLGSDGDKVRGALERDFADYARKAQRNRRGVLLAVALPLLRPVLARGAKAATDWLTTPGRMDELRLQAEAAAAEGRASAERAGSAARQRVDQARASDAGSAPSDEEPATGV
jgi:hypothetical protein